jgi:hypothetical protein
MKKDARFGNNQTYFGHDFVASSSFLFYLLNNGSL